MEKNRVCPWQHASLLTIFFRKLLQNPERILAPHLKDGMTAADIGCGIGYFSIPMKDLVGDKGTVIAVDLQPQMLDGLKHRAAESGTPDIVLHQCSTDSLELDKWEGKVDFALVFWMLHEVPDKQRFIREAHSVLSENGALLFAEPKGHVSEKEFAKSLEMMTSTGFKTTETPKITLSRAALLAK